MKPIDPQLLRTLLQAVGAHLQAASRHVAIVVVGGAALSLRGWIERTTHDVDVIAVLEGEQLVPPDLPEALLSAAHTVARDFSLDPDWLNAVVGAQW